AVNSLNDRIAANNQPLTRPGTSKGNVTVVSTRCGGAPRLAAGSSSRGSRVRSGMETLRSTKGSTGTTWQGAVTGKPRPMPGSASKARKPGAPREGRTPQGGGTHP